MTLVRVDGQVHHGNARVFERANERRLFLGIEAIVLINAEDEVAMPRLSGSLQQLREILGTALTHGIESRPHFTDSQVGIGVEALHELFPLMQHV